VAIEHEAKLHAPDGFRLPDLATVDGALVPSEQRRQRMLAVYYDTPDLALARSGVTLRHRTDDDAEPWTVKLAESSSGTSLARHELTFAGRPGRVPDAAADLVRAHTRGRPLVPVARLRTLRSVRNLVDADGGTAVEIADDRVSVYSGFRRIARFRELEVELKSQDPSRAGVVDEVVERLVAAGAARTEPLSKLVRGLGAAAQRAPDVVVGTIGKKCDAREFVRHVVAGSVSRMLAQDPALRLEAGERDVHAFRVATRRLRSDLRTFRPLLVAEWASTLRAELKWIADVVGAVRDADVLDIRLRRKAAELGAHDAIGAGPLLALLEQQRSAARAQMMEALRTPRYDALLSSLVEAASQPQFAAAADVDVAARDVVADVVRRSWRQLRRAVRAAGKHPSDEDLHHIRIVAKRTRYAAEAAARVHGARAERFANAIADVQTVLGDHHDSSVAETWLRDAARAGGGGAQSGVTAGMIIARQQRERDRLERAWRDVWRRASRSKLRRWF
jgi:CHAD domain-containing protein